MRMMPVAGTTKRIIAGRGERGMSMPLVLLLFLVCTVAASITITAATTAAGRATNLAEDDRLFYSASSAATVLTREISESNVKFSVKKTETGGSTSYSLYVVRGNTEELVDGKTDLSLVEWASIVAFFGVDPRTSGVTSEAIARVYDVDQLKPLELAPVGYTPPVRDDLKVSLSLDGGDSSITTPTPDVSVSVKADIDLSFTVTVVASEPDPKDSSKIYKSSREVCFAIGPEFQFNNASNELEVRVKCTPTVEETGV